jgi:hypothetical protein
LTLFIRKAGFENLSDAQFIKENLETSAFQKIPMMMPEIQMSAQRKSRNVPRLQRALFQGASPRVCQINLASIYFWQNRKNCAPTVWHPTWQILATWQISPLHAYICALSASAHPASRANLSGALRFLAGLFVS